MDDDKIDFVILWVDGSDEEWLKEKKKYKTDIDVADSIVRYRDWDNLQYWFRGIEKFTPWVNKIHFITWGHIPKWLNTKNPKLNIVNHKDYMKPEYLPSYNSTAIELSLGFLECLSEKFVYFNDDFFIINKCKKEDFFVNDLPCDEYSEAPIIPDPKEFLVRTIYYNNMLIY